MVFIRGEKEEKGKEDKYIYAGLLGRHSTFSARGTALETCFCFEPKLNKKVFLKFFYPK